MLAALAVVGVRAATTAGAVGGRSPPRRSRARRVATRQAAKAPPASPPTPPPSRRAWLAAAVLAVRVRRAAFTRSPGRASWRCCSDRRSTPSRRRSPPSSPASRSARALGTWIVGRGASRPRGWSRSARGRGDHADVAYVSPAGRSRGSWPWRWRSAPDLDQRAARPGRQPHRDPDPADRHLLGRRLSAGAALAARGPARRDRRGASASSTPLNTLGAVSGSLIAGFVFIPRARPADHVCRSSAPA